MSPMEAAFFLAETVSILFCIMFAFYAVTRAPRSFDNLCFAVGLLSLAAIVAGDLLPGTRLSVSPGWRRLALAGEALFPAAWLVFATRFGEPERRGFRLSYFAGIAAVGFSLVVALRPSPPSLFAGREGDLFFVSRGGYVFYLLAVLVAVLALVRLEGLIWFTRGATRWAVKYAVIGAGGLLGIYIYYYSFPVLYGALDISLIPVRNAVFLVSLLLLTGAFLRQGFLGGNVFVSRRIVFPSAALLAVGLYFIALGLVGETVRRFDETLSRNLIVFLVFTGLILFAVLFLSESFRQRAKRFITDNFYRHRYEYKDEWLKFTGRLAGANSHDEVVAAILEIMGETFGVDHVCYWAAGDDAETLRHEACNRGSWAGRPDSPFPGGAVMKRLRAGEVLDRNAGLPAGVPDAGAWEEVRAEVLIPLLASDERLLGVVVLGRNLGGFDYDDEDYELMKTLARQGAYAIEKTRLAAELAEAREMEAMGKLTAFVLHDLKNMTTSLSMLLKNAEAYIDRPEFRQDMIRTIRNTVGRMSSVTGKLADLRREGSPCMAPVDLAALACETLDEMSIPDRIVLRRPEGPCSVVVRADRDQIRKVLVNLVLNAVQAIEGAGSIAIDFFSEKGFGCVKISDTGCGISDEYLRNGLFRPFRSTKKNGLGIGLFHCRAIVDGHGGRLEIRSAEGKGTTAVLRLPLEEEGGRG